MDVTALFEVASQAVAVASLVPIRSVPPLTALTTKAVTVPSMSASLPAAARAAKGIGIAESSLPVATEPANCVSVGGSLTAATAIRTVFVAAESNPPSKALTVKASSVPLTVGGGVQTRLSPAATVVEPPVTGAPFFVSVPPSTDSIRKEIGSLFGSLSSSADAIAAYVSVKARPSVAPEIVAAAVPVNVGAWLVIVTAIGQVAVPKPLKAETTTL